MLHTCKVNKLLTYIVFIARCSPDEPRHRDAATEKNCFVIINLLLLHVRLLMLCLFLFQKAEGVKIDVTDQNAMYIKMVGKYRENKSRESSSEYHASSSS